MEARAEARRERVKLAQEERDRKMEERRKKEEAERRAEDDERKRMQLEVLKKKKESRVFIINFFKYYSYNLHNIIINFRHKKRREGYETSRRKEEREKLNVLSN